MLGRLESKQKLSLKLFMKIAAQDRITLLFISTMCFIFNTLLIKINLCVYVVNVPTYN